MCATPVLSRGKRHKRTKYCQIVYINKIEIELLFQNIRAIQMMTLYWMEQFLPMIYGISVRTGTVKLRLSMRQEHQKVAINCSNSTFWWIGNENKLTLAWKMNRVELIPWINFKLFLHLRLKRWVSFLVTFLNSKILIFVMSTYQIQLKKLAVRYIVVAGICLLLILVIWRRLHIFQVVEQFFPPRIKIP